MAEFILAFDTMILDEGGYKLHVVKGDRGGQTYAGIARNFNPSWRGWDYIDQDKTPPTSLVQGFYRQEYWDVIKGDQIKQQAIASSIFNYGVNAGAKTAIKLAQAVVGTTPDGDIGPKTLEALNLFNPDRFLTYYALAKIARSAAICNRDRSQSKFLLGWVNRALKGVV